MGTLVFDPAGSLYGATYAGGAYGNGVVFKLTPAQTVNGKRMCSTRSRAARLERNPFGGVVFDAAGNLYGPTYDGAAGHTRLRHGVQADRRTHTGAGTSGCHIQLRAAARMD